MMININQIKVVDRFRKDLGDLEELANSIKDVGLLQPPVITEEDVLVVGERRLAACKLLDWQQIEVRKVKFEDYLQQIKAERDENTTRKDFTFSEMVELGKKIEAVEHERTKQISLSNLKQCQNMVTECQNSDTRENTRMATECPNSDTRENSRTDDKIAQEIGLGSRDTYHKAKFIAEYADPEIIEQLNEKQISVNKAYQQTKTKLEATDRALMEAKSKVQSLERDMEAAYGRAVQSEEELREAERKICQFQEAANDLVRKAKRETQRESDTVINNLENKITAMSEKISKLTAAEQNAKDKTKELSEKHSDAKKRLAEIESLNLQKKLDSALVEIKNLKERPITEEMEKILKNLEGQKKYLETEISDRQNAVVIVNEMRKITKALNGLELALSRMDVRMGDFIGQDEIIYHEAVLTRVANLLMRIAKPEVDVRQKTRKEGNIIDITSFTKEGGVHGN